MPEIKEELNSLLMRVKEESEKAGLKLSIQNAKIMASGPITSSQVEREKVKNTVKELVSFILYFGGGTEYLNGWK